MWELGVALEAMLSARCLKIRTQECGYIECIKCTPGLKLLLVQLHEYVESGTVTNHCTCRAKGFITTIHEEFSGTGGGAQFVLSGASEFS